LAKPRFQWGTLSFLAWLTLALLSDWLTIDGFAAASQQAFDYQGGPTAGIAISPYCQDISKDYFMSPANLWHWPSKAMP
jgi:hypothetical protein